MLNKVYFAEESFIPIILYSYPGFLLAKYNVSYAIR